MTSLISATAWVRRGVAAQHPTKYVLDKKELSRVSALARVEVEDARLELECASKLPATMWKDLDHADDAEDVDGDGQWEDVPSDHGGADMMDTDDRMDEVPVPVAKSDPNDLSEYNLDTYDEDTEVATDASFAGDSTQLDYTPEATAESSTKAGNYIAVGTFDPEIEIWSLEAIDGLYPDGILGRPDKWREDVPVPLGTGKKKRKKQKARKANAEYHVDAVLGLSWNRAHRNLIASVSAYKTVKLWDLSWESTSPAIRSFDVHKDQVQAVQWNPAKPTMLKFDSRDPMAGVGAVLGADVEVLGILTVSS